MSNIPQDIHSEPALKDFNRNRVWNEGAWPDYHIICFPVKMQIILRYPLQ